MRLDRRIGLFVVLATIFVVSLVVGDIIGGKLLGIRLFGHTFNGTVGMIPFPVTFLLTHVLNEFYGKRSARFVTWVGFAMALFSFTIIFIAAALPISEIAKGAAWTGVKEDAFNNVLAGGQRILIASMIAYLISQFSDIAVFNLLKRLAKNRFLWLRATGSTVVSQMIDTVVINTVAWYGIMTVDQIFNIAVSSYVIKLIVAIGLTPLIYAGHVIVERMLHMKPVILDENGEPIEHAGDPI